MGTGTKQLGANEREGKEEKVRCEMLFRQKKSRLSEKLHEGWSEEVAEAGLGLCETVWRSSRWHRAYKRVKLRRQMAAAAGQTVSVSLSLIMEVNSLEVEECFMYHGHALLGGRRVDEQMGKRAAEGVEGADL